MRIPTWLPYGASVGASAAALAASAVLRADEFWLHAARWTARAAFAIFIILFLIRPLRLAAVWGSRRDWGLGFALCHAVHLVSLTVHVLRVNLEVSEVTLLGGGLGFALTAAMAVTSTAAWQRRLGRWWRRLHRTGLYYLWVIFAFSYVGRLKLPETFWIGAVGTFVAFAALLLRQVAPRMRRR